MMREMKNANGDTFYICDDGVMEIEEPPANPYEASMPGRSPAAMQGQLQALALSDRAAAECEWMHGNRSVIVEIRDDMTFIPALALRLEPFSEAERYLLSRAGFGQQPEQQRGYILLVKLNDIGRNGGTTCPGEQKSKTMIAAHQWLYDHWDEVRPGMVIDAGHIRGEREPLPPEREWAGGGEPTPGDTAAQAHCRAKGFCCRKCNPEMANGITRIFTVCSICGNKRCPHADDHDFMCTDSNVPGQAGRRYGFPPGVAL